MTKAILFFIGVLLIDVLVVTFCFPLALLSIDTIAQVSLIVFAASVFSAAILNSMYHVFVVDTNSQS